MLDFYFIWYNLVGYFCFYKIFGQAQENADGSLEIDDSATDVTSPSQSVQDSEDDNLDEKVETRSTKRPLEKNIIQQNPRKVWKKKEDPELEILKAISNILSSETSKDYKHFKSQCQ